MMLVIAHIFEPSLLFLSVLQFSGSLRRFSISPWDLFLVEDLHFRRAWYQAKGSTFLRIAFPLETCKTDVNLVLKLNSFRFDKQEYIDILFVILYITFYCFIYICMMIMKFLHHSHSILYYIVMLYYCISKYDTILHYIRQGQGGNLCRGYLLVPQTVCRWEFHDTHGILSR